MARCFKLLIPGFLGHNRLKNKDKKKGDDMNWGNKIAVVFALFVALVITMVTISFNQDVNLVAENYYEEEIAYQSHMKKVANAMEWDTPIKVEQQGDVVYLYFQNAGEVEGEITFFRPSDAKMDFKVDLEEENYIPVEKLQSGVWQVDISWSKGEKAYHKEERIFIQK
ncbi:FixH family protein [Marivirga lumbricoides]|uniref:FixH family protein n=1 Tax=Marivirga lumbricoides TaxID=1046115 RepID=UPI0031EB58BA